ncbi:hypothetical protein NDU88_002780 [Pleurodeles waltl]|uniref:Uncharacterized protein n=1 Tax=Pleurodeles waltl TaxID=8319 RepID=A0AAV7RBB6_PLEWA|nr:hypothetical protein NDU88_002780 [Pleurodeles waltl]
MGSLLPNTSPYRRRTPTLLLGTPAGAWSTPAVPRLPEAAVAPTSPLVRATQHLPPGTDAARSWIPGNEAPEAGHPADQALATPRIKWWPRLSLSLQFSGGRAPRPLDFDRPR